MLCECFAPANTATGLPAASPGCLCVVIAVPGSDVICKGINCGVTRKVTEVGSGGPACEAGKAKPAPPPLLSFAGRSGSAEPALRRRRRRSTEAAGDQAVEGVAT